PGVEEVGGDRVPETMGVALVGRQSRLACIEAEQGVNTLAANGLGVARGEEIREGIAPALEVALQQAATVCRHHLLPRDAPFEARDGDPAGAEVNLLAQQQADL